ncbi:MAG: hypothetical protein ACTSO9_08300 [Candidatus Helarchaeota archaeon]
MSKKYAEEFTKYIEKFNELGSLDYISREFLGLMRQKCFNCNRNRVECAFQPHCENRKYMNVMVHMKLDLNDIPDFCYSQQLRNINDYLTGKAYLIEPIDYKVFLSDFVQILNIKLKSEHKKKNILISEIIKNISTLKGKVYKVKHREDIKDYFMFITDGIIYHIDLIREIVTINLRNKIIETEEELTDIIDLFSQYYNVKVEIIEEMRGWWYLKAIIPSKKLKSENIIIEYKNKIQEFSEFVNYYPNNDFFYFLIDIKNPNYKKWKDLKISVSNLNEIFILLNGLSKKIA